MQGMWGLLARMRRADRRTNMQVNVTREKRELRSHVIVFLQHLLSFWLHFTNEKTKVLLTPFHVEGLHGESLLLLCWGVCLCCFV